MQSFNFGSAQSILPRSVLAAIFHDIAGWRDRGISLLELPFVHTDFADLLTQIETDLRALLALSQRHHILLLAGGATAQFGLLPMNLLGDKHRADYVETGYWSRRAMMAARPWCDVHRAAQGDGTFLPQIWHLSADAAYCHVTTNETADGLQFHELPDTGDVPLVADMTADFLTRPIPIEQFDLIYASAQKNLGIAGLTIVVLRDNLLNRAKPGVPAPFDYSAQAKAESKVNTPPTFAVAVTAKMLNWLRENGGLAAIGARNARKSARLYAEIDADEFYQSHVRAADRSLVSVCFHLPDSRLDAMFLAKAEANGFFQLHGHPSVGGIRASLYNAVSEEAVDALASFMADFRDRHG